MRKRTIYVASSWRNEIQQQVVGDLRLLGHEVYDFRNPTPRNTGFKWESVDPGWKNWTTEQYREALSHHEAKKGFRLDYAGINWADTCVLVLPCGRSAHTEAGWMAGSGKEVFVYIPGSEEPELMYKLCDGILINRAELLDKFSM